MTTIAYDGYTLACDGRVVGHTIDSDNFKKIIKVGDVYAGAAGDLRSVSNFFDWVKKGCVDYFETEDSFGGVLIKGNKTIVFDTKGSELSIKPPFADGSGGELALGAMLAGATAIQAVKIACKKDPRSGGRIFHYDIKPRPKHK